MLRLIKLAIYAVVGYAIYEIYRGMTEGRGDDDDGGEKRRGLLTGGGAGMRVQSDEEETGTSIPHTVGRGVVS